MFTKKMLDVWVKSLKAGDVVVAPAEGVYGYCADPFHEKALKKLINIKQRDPHKGLICLVAHMNQLNQICAPLKQEEIQLIEKYWQHNKKNPTTLILPVNKNMPSLLTGGRKTIAVRLPHVVYMQQYLQAWGQPLVSSSLNKTGALPVTHIQNIPQHMPALVLSEPLSGKASTIITLKGDKLR